MQLNKQKLRDIIKAALDEDIGSGDVTTEAIIDQTANIKAEFVTREDTIVCGIPFLEEVFSFAENNLKLFPNSFEGNYIQAGDKIFTVSGNAQTILKLERVALNILQYACGIATNTKKFVDEVKHTKVKILDTRKTHPNLRLIAKYAVWIGGGTNHRFGLFDAFLIKDNHLKILKGDIKQAIEQAKENNPNGLKIEIECDSISQFEEAIKHKPDIILLDNMLPKQLEKAVKINDGKVLLEASGGIDIENVKEIAETGVDYISIGALTHSSKNIDIGLDFS